MHSIVFTSYTCIRTYIYNEVYSSSLYRNNEKKYFRVDLEYR